MSAQYFKGDDTEKKYFNSGKAILDSISLQKTDFFNDAYNSQPLGDLIKADGRSPLANAIDPNIFRAAFNQIFEAFISGGSFDSYLLVFEKIFGDEAEIEFTVPGPGMLNIDIVAVDIELSPFITRYILNNAYFIDNIVDWDGDNICFQSIQGFQSQYELEQMLFEMVPAGIYTEISLTIGEP